jgi:hypothetical protein
MRFYQTLLPACEYPEGSGPNRGEVMSPDAQEFRLQSDYTLARYASPSVPPFFLP